MLSVATCCRYNFKQTLTLALRSYRGRPQNVSPVISHVFYTTDQSCRHSDGGDKRSKRRKQPASTRCDPMEICYRPYKPPPVMDHDYKNMALRRPMSPHLDVVSMTLPATMSIIQRITGVIITGYALLLAGGSLFLTNGIETYVSMIQSLDLSPNLIMALKVIVGLPFTYHFFNGIRFCLWNSGKFLSLSEVYFTAKVAMFCIVVATGVWAYI